MIKFILSTAVWAAIMLFFGMLVLPALAASPFFAATERFALNRIL